MYTHRRRRIGQLLVLGALLSVLWLVHDRHAPHAAAVAAPATAPGASPSSPAAASAALPARYRGQVVRHRVRYFPRKLLALTFDDGPDPAITPRLLATLKKHGAHATFFVLGRCASKQLALVKQAAREGHAIGNHSYSHPQSTSPAVARQELQRTAALIKQATGHQPRLFRPPYGITTGNLCREAQREGYTAFLWTISSADTRPISSATIARNIIHTPNPGDIVLMHDGAGHRATAGALDQILTELGAAGFTFVTLPELLSAWDRYLAEHPAPKSTKTLKGG